MSSKFKLKDKVFIGLTPTGAYHSVSSNKKNNVRAMLRWLLKQPDTPYLDINTVDEWTPEDKSIDYSLHLLYLAEQQGLVQGLKEKQFTPSEPLEVILPKLLPKISGNNGVLLVDDQGLCIEDYGFSNKNIEQLAALSADIASLHERHIELLQNDFGLNRSAWGVINPAGKSQIGFWPIFIREHRFVLVVSGKPNFNQPALVTLMRVLSMRYA